MNQHTLRRIKRSTLAAVSALALVLASMTAATASAADLDSADATAQHIAEVAPGATDLAPVDIFPDVVIPDSDAADAEIRLDADDGVAIVVGGEDGMIETVIGLPTDTLDVARGEVAEDGTVVYSAVDSEDAIAVQTLADGSTRVQTVIGGASSAHSFGYSLDGFSPTLSSSGDAMFINDDGAFVPVEAPWAVDASGASVETFYSVDGNELVQTVVPNAGTSYPVVADPSWVWVNAGWGMKLNRTETSSVRNYAAAVGMCVIFAKRLAVGCAFYSSYMQLQANLAQSDSPRTCLHLVVVPAPGSIWRVKC